MKEGLITSPQNAKIKLVRALSGRTRERRQAGAFVAEGVRLLEEALASNWPFRFALYTSGLGERGQQLLTLMAQRGIEVEQISSKLLSAIGETESSQGILAVLADEAPQPVRPLHFVLIVDSVRDPGNLGSLLRAAEAAGVDAVFLAPGTTDAFAPKVVRAGMGAHFRLPLYEVSWEEMRTQVSVYGWSVYLADMQGRSCWETAFQTPLALIIGGEAEGATAPARALATQSVSIPMQGKAESLNAAVAGAVLMFEVLRQGRATSRGAA